MKILLVNSLYPPEIMGGAEVSVSLLAEALAGLSHQVSVVCLQKDRQESTDEIKGVRVHRLPIDNDYWPFARDEKPPRLKRLMWHVRDTWNRKAAERFGAILDAEAPDVLHTNNLTGFSVSLWAEAKRRNIRIVHTLRDYSLLCKRSTLFRNGLACKDRCVACVAMTTPYLYASRMVDAVVSNSQFVLDAHRNLGYFPKAPNKVIFNIADADVISPAPRLAGGDLVFGFIGRIEPEKGIEVVLDATRLLPDRGWKLKIAGRGVNAYVDKLKVSAQNPRIEWLGFASSREFYSNVDVCLISSVWPEPLPRTLIESISAGRATICSTAGGIPEISQFSNMIGSYEPYDFRRLAELMSEGIREADRWRMLQPPRPGLSTKFAPEAITQEYLQVYSAGN